jgi:hypothetical protein
MNPADTRQPKKLSSARDDDHNRSFGYYVTVTSAWGCFFGIWLAIGLGFLPNKTGAEKFLIFCASAALSTGNVVGFGAWKNARRFTVTAMMVGIAIICLAALSIQASDSGRRLPISSTGGTTSPAPTTDTSAPSATSRPTGASPTPPSPTPSTSTTSPPPSPIPIVPPTNDPGFNQVWHGSVNIDAAGIRIISSGIVQGTPQDWNIAYQAGGSDAGWQFNSDNSDIGYFWYWDSTGSPGPAFCSREYEQASGQEPQTASLGDKYCYGDQRGIVGYIQVTKTGGNGPTVMMWLWAKSG